MRISFILLALAFLAGGAFAAANSNAIVVQRPILPQPGTLAAAVLLTPVNGATNVATPVTLTWNRVANADNYSVQLATDARFATVVGSIAGLTTTSYQPPALQPGTKYFWQVKAIQAQNTLLIPQMQQGTTGATVQRDMTNLIDAISQTPYTVTSTSAVWSFTTASATPPAAQTLVAPALLAPQNGITAPAANMALRWRPVAGATVYGVQISTSATFGGNVVNASSATIGFTSANLSAGTKYYWRVMAKTEATQSVAVQNEPQVNNNNPYGDIINTLPYPTTSPTAGQTNTTSASPAISSAWSDTWSFTTATPAATALSAPVLTSPVDKSINITAPLTVSWQAVSGASSYTVQIATSSNFAAGLATFDNIAATSQVLNTLLSNTNYVWRVRATNGTRTSDWSTPCLFTTALPAPAYGVDATIHAVGSDNPAIGAGVFDTIGTQTEGLIVPMGTPAVFMVTVRNLGNVSDHFVVKGGAASTGWMVKYFGVTGADVTHSATSAGWTTPEVAAGGNLVFRVELTPGSGSSTTVPQEALVTVNSVKAPTNMDSVKAVAYRE